MYILVEKSCKNKITPGKTYGLVNLRLLYWKELPHRQSDYPTAKQHENT